MKSHFMPILLFFNTRLEWCRGKLLSTKKTPFLNLLVRNHWGKYAGHDFVFLDSKRGKWFRSSPCILCRNSSNIAKSSCMNARQLKKHLIGRTIKGWPIIKYKQKHTNRMRVLRSIKGKERQALMIMQLPLARFNCTA